MKEKHLPGSLGDRVRELRERDKLTQGELAARIGTSASTLSRIEKGEIESPGSDIVVKLARVFRVSTDFLLGITDFPDRMNYEVGQLGLSPEAARRLNSGEVDMSVLNRMVMNPCFPTISRNISSYLDGSLEAGIHIQNDMIASAMDMARPFPAAQMELSAMKMPSALALERLMMRMELMLRSMKKDTGEPEHADQQERDSQVAKDVQREIYALREKLSRELGKYKQMFSVAKYQETIETEEGSVAIEHYDEIIDAELEQLQIQQRSLKKELRRLDQAIKDNKHFSDFISSMKLLVKGPDGTPIPVTAENIIGFDDSIEYLITKHKLVSSQLSSVLKQISAREKKSETEGEQLSFWESESVVEVFDRRIASLQINAVAIDKEIGRLEKELKDVRQAITTSTKINNEVVSSLYQNVLKYAVELGIGNDATLAASYLFMSNLKELSGAILHKTVFAFRLAYIIEIEKAIGIKLPIIMDSPSGKEVDQDNIRLMMNILKRDFSDHQIIIASIFMYEFDPLNVIEIVNRLFEDEIIQ